MKYLPINANLFVKNREKLKNFLPPKSVAIFNSNDIYPKGSADGTIKFQQHPDLFYLSGVDQEESVLLIFPDNPSGEKEILFLKKTNEQIAIWEGEKLTAQKAFETSGIRTVYWLEDMWNVLQGIIPYAENIFLNHNEHLRAKVDVATRDDRFRKVIAEKYPLHQLKRIAPFMHQLRAVKEQEEIDLMQMACNITEKGLRRVLKFVKPNVYEFEIEAEILHEFMINRANGFAYEPIIASGANACVLHYVQNNAQCADGDLILMDFGAEYANYDSDLTRCIPVNGRFTDRQKQVYQAVLNVKKKAEQLLRPGVLLNEYHKEVGHIMTDELLKLSLLDKTDIKNENPQWPAYKKYFMHGTSHYIGIDTHDVGLWNEPLKEGMVFTCEPGIYIREENLGIRLEDDLLVTSNNPKNLMANIPIEVEEIEALMNG